MRIEVDCGGGKSGEATPRRLWLGRRAVEVVEVLDRWPSAEHEHFKVLGSDGAIYIVRHDARNRAWELVHYRRTPEVGADAE